LIIAVVSQFLYHSDKELIENVGGKIGRNIQTDIHRIRGGNSRKQTCLKSLEAATGFEPVNNGFADIFKPTPVKDFKHLPLPKMPFWASIAPLLHRYAPDFLAVSVFSVIQLSHSFTVGTRDQVAVNIHGGPYAAMAQLIFHVNQAFVILDKQAGEGMAQVMHPDPAQTRLTQCSVKNPVPEIEGINALPLSPNKHNVWHGSLAPFQGQPPPLGLQRSQNDLPPEN
jgi:hypothetical protein